MSKWRLYWILVRKTLRFEFARAAIHGIRTGDMSRCYALRAEAKSTWRHIGRDGLFGPRR